MPRKGSVPKREVLQDPVYGEVVITKLINQVMLDGKRGTAQQICYGAFDIIAEKTGKDAMEVFNQALNNIMPVLEVKARRLGGATYQVRWLVNAARSRNEKTMMQRLAGELLDAYNGNGGAVKKKEDTHRMAEANKAFAHFKW